MSFEQMLALLVQILLIAGAVNWGLVAYNGMDLVTMATRGGDFDRYVKYAVGLAGLYAAYLLARAYLM